MTERPADAAFDVVIIGAGVIGCAVAAALASHSLRICLLDAAEDVGDGTSKANTAILHTGFDATPDTIESSLVARGYHLLGEYAAEAGIPVERTGAVLVAWDDEQRDALPALAAKAAQNGYTAAALLSAPELYAAEPNLGPGALGGLAIPDEAIICPWTTTLAYATQAVIAGVDLRLRTRVVDAHPTDSGTVLEVDSGATIAASWVVNAAGLTSDVVNRMFGHDEFRIYPRRGELIVFDKLSRPLVQHIVLPVPTSRGKGVLVAPTVFGNVLLGPTAEEVDVPGDTATTSEGLEFLLGHGRRIVPRLLDEEVTTTYAGVRAATEHGDYQIRCHPDQRYLCLGGIRSTGLTSSLAVAEHAVALLADAGLTLGPARPAPIPRLPNLGEAFPRPYQRAELIKDQPGYGDLVCHCERVSRQELVDATASTVPAVTLEGLRRRTRAMMGRCQGFYCAAEVTATLAHQRPGG